jgi:hypothetical protein
METPRDLQIACEMLAEQNSRIEELNSSNADLLEALLYLLDSLPFGARGEPGSRMDRAITASAEAIAKARGEEGK